MTELNWERHKITSLTKDKLGNIAFLRFGPDEYDVSHLDMIKFQVNDYVDVLIEKGVIKDIRFPPGMEPVSPSKNEIEKKMVDEARNKKEIQYHIVSIGNGKAVVKKGEDGDDRLLILKDKALLSSNKLKTGDLVNFSFIEGSSTEVRSLFKVDENGKWIGKNGYNNGSSGNVEIAASIIAGAILAKCAQENKLSEVDKGLLLADAISFQKVICEGLKKEVKP